jgi:hypothetical protein
VTGDLAARVELLERQQAVLVAEVARLTRAQRPRPSETDDLAFAVALAKINPNGRDFDAADIIKRRGIDAEFKALADAVSIVTTADAGSWLKRMRGTVVGDAELTTTGRVAAGMTWAFL